MAEVKCEYCGHLIDDSKETCPFCSAPNPAYRRFSGDKRRPRTIEELQEWYRARNLPPENVTRFFIGKDVKEPKAFGIYKDDWSGDFIVYKNKANGERAVRYEGKDEDYAVNELYLKLKEEILNQKARNKARRSPNKKRNLLQPLLYMIFMIMVPVLSVIGTSIDSSDSKKYNDYYTQDGKTVYYRYDNWSSDDEWWKYTDSSWSLYGYLPEEQTPEDWIIEENSYYWLSDIEDKYSVQIASLYDARDYIDLHHYEPSDGYYTSGSDIFYYLNDYYGENYGSGDKSGWYRYDDGNWSYYCGSEDKDTLGEDLWYSPDDHREWNISDFESDQAISPFTDSETYHEYEAAKESYDEYNQSNNSNNDSNWDWDNDYDWDSGDDWDYDSGDWDSDW